MEKNILKADAILELLKASNKFTASEIARILSSSPKDIINKLLILESFRHVRQLNGYWFYEPSYVNRLTSSTITDLIFNWGPLTFPEITSLVGYHGVDVKAKLRTVIAKKLVGINSQGKYFLIGQNR